MLSPPRHPETVTVKIPPTHGPGSGKEAWKALALTALDMNDSLSAIIATQREVIRDLQAEMGLLRRQIADRKPKGSRPKTPDETVEAIERAFAKRNSTRAIARAYGVSPMTVSRVRKRVQARNAEPA